MGYTPWSRTESDTTEQLSLKFSLLIFIQFLRLGFPCSSAGKESAYNPGDPDLILGWEDALEKEMATHSSILA